MRGRKAVLRNVYNDVGWGAPRHLHQIGDGFGCNRLTIVTYNLQNQPRPHLMSSQ
ncbi:hypothetical protein AB4Z52_33905 [Rhizobium sp. 2YAF20]|uniref:hypothetical protein n=1 Tax=Rhizobium sp. 2YAF20 TaxID=3233027 RepID=UPI003F96AFAC